MRERSMMGQERNASTEAMRARGSRPITRDEVARRAYELYMARGAQHGHAMEDWLQAERELRERVPMKTAPRS